MIFPKGEQTIISIWRCFQETREKLENISLMFSSCMMPLENINADRVPVDLVFFQDRVPTRRNYNPFNSLSEAKYVKKCGKVAQENWDAGSLGVLSCISHNPV